VWDLLVEEASARSTFFKEKYQEKQNKNKRK